MTMPASSELAIYLLALQRIPRIGVWTAVQIARTFPTSPRWLEASPEELVEKLGKRAASPLIEAPRDQWGTMVESAERDVADHLERGVGVVAIGDAFYPPLMGLAPNPAAILYVRGEASVLRRTDAAAVIGTRQPTKTGTRVAHRLAKALASGGFVVVSGLAKGIDDSAHKGALDAGGSTVAVLGTAIDKIYPAANRPLADRILREGGALISEYPIGFATSGRHFVERDRLQAAMSIAVIAVQTGVEGGTLHTVRFAAEARRAVLVPRPIEAEGEHAMYGGIRALISEQRAAVIEGAESYPKLLEFLVDYRDWLLGADPTASQPVFSPAQPEAAAEPSQTCLEL